MAEKKKFLLRIDPDLFEALERWASDELRSSNAQIEFILKDAVRRAGREKSSSTKREEGSETTQ